MRIGFSNCRDSLFWHYSSRGSSKQAFKEGMIAPSRNLLSRQAYNQRHQVKDIDERVKKIAREHDLTIPLRAKSPLSMSDHCFAASLHFLKRYRDSHDIQKVAVSMKDGVDSECAQTSLIHSELFENNSKKQVTDEKSSRVFLERVSQVVVKSIGLSITDRMTLHYPVDSVLPYIKEALPIGEYYIAFPTHVVALVKNSGGKVYLHDINQGTLDLDTNEGKTEFLKLLKKHKVHHTETLTFNKVSEDTSGQKIRESTVEFAEDKPELTFEKGKDRWGIAVFKWRKKTYCFPWDSVEKYIYNQNSIALLRFKCVLLTPRNLIDNPIRIMGHATKAALKILTLPLAVIFRKTKRQLRQIVKSIGDIEKTALFGIVGMGVAFYGIFKPLDGRRIYGYLERNLNEQNHMVNFRQRYYIAPCFTPVNHGKSQEDTIKTLKGVVLRSESFKGNHFFELFFGWRKTLPCFKA